ncbi:MAG TPA: aspartate carbamoyltransferase catalytic subunit [bacterium]|nr:aspartate carbamoyltransferase catalytic subunit [bacterium]
MGLKITSLLDLSGVGRDDINLILDTAQSLKQINLRPIKKVPTLRGRTQVNLFFEPSTRTRMSFEIAGKRLSADTVNFTSSSSSTTKGETLMDTVKNIQAMKPDILVIRHQASGAPHMIAKMVPTPVINAGDGAHAHPSQALLDMFTVREKLGRLDKLKIVIVGDIQNSRVARSNIQGFTIMGSTVWVCGPPTLIPPGIEEMGAKVSYDLDRVIADADVIMMLRIQLERGSGTRFPTLREYSIRYGLNLRRLERARPDALIMHPGPINRGVEISPEVADGPRSIILDQVENGVAVRMALLYLLCGGTDETAN